MRSKCGIMVALLLGLLTGPAFAQGRTVSGTVRDSLNSAPIAGAYVAVRGALHGASTNAAGQFALANVSVGEVTLLVRAIGFSRREVVLGTGASTVDVSLGRDVFRIEEVVVTGQAAWLGETFPTRSHRSAGRSSRPTPPRASSSSSRGRWPAPTSKPTPARRAAASRSASAG